MILSRLLIGGVSELSEVLGWDRADETEVESSLFEQLLRLRDRQRDEGRGFQGVIKGRDVPIELSPLGRIQWYLHPLLQTGAHVENFWVTHIAGGSKTGKLKCQGGQIYYVWRGGPGHSVLNGESYEWNQGCVILIPLLAEGVSVQHFNDDPDKEAILLGAEENMVHCLGVDRGAGFELVECCPEWLAIHGSA